MEIIKQAVKNVWSNKVRSFLTMLGIIIGVMAVIIIMGLGSGLAGMMNGMFSSMGGELLVASLDIKSTRSVSVDDMYHIIRQKPELYGELSPVANSSGQLRVAGKTYSRSLIRGVNEGYLLINNYKIAQGRGIQYADLMDKKNVCVVGDYVNREIFGGNSLGQTLKVNGNEYRIVGVLAGRYRQAAQEAGGEDDVVYLPYTTLSRVGGDVVINTYYVGLEDVNKKNEAKDFLKTELENLISREDIVTVESLSESTQQLATLTNVVVGVLTAIAGISLLVGGIGIMNIMLVSVTERTREIGIRKALGAQEDAILMQFVMEAAVTSVAGGGIGTLLGYLISNVINQIVPIFVPGLNFNVIPTAGAAATAVGISCGIGVLFGYLPARRAARLNPIEALRYD